MPNSIEKLKKYLKLEIKRDYDNQAIFGGFQNLVKSWQAQAFADGSDPIKVTIIIQFFEEYQNLSKKQRKETIAEILNLIDLPSYHSAKGHPSTQKIAESESTASAYLTPLSDQNFKSKISNQNSLQLNSHASLTSIPFIGKSREKMLQNMGIYRIEDLIYYFPRKYEDYSKLRTIDQLVFGEQVTIIASVKNISIRRTRNRNIQISEVIVDDGTGTLRLSFFNQPYLERQLKKEMQIEIKGKIEMYLGRLTINSPQWAIINPQDLNLKGITAVYRLPIGFSQKYFRKIIHETLSIWINEVEDYLPKDSIITEGLLPLKEAITTIHQPPDFDVLQKAMLRISFDQIFFLQMGMLSQKRDWNRKSADKYEISPSFLKNLLSSLPFELTQSQVKTIEAIKTDFESGSPMNRLLQGDVGSGKTIVALIATAFIFTRMGTQCAIMAPTSILAEQHFRNAQKFYTQNGILSAHQIELLIGDTPDNRKQEIRDQLANGKIRLLIGTHALIETPIEFSNLQLVVIDEQHRFGVEQRKKLNEKGVRAHLLAMTATPIPRSLALTVYGDLDLSIMRELPKGRQTIATHIIQPKDRNQIYRVIADKISKGQQAFIVYPFVESDNDDEDKSSAAAVNEYDRLQEEIFPQFKLALLHGRLNPDTKDTVMHDFYRRKYQILVSTTVIEVGVDIPNATVMVIEGANRFGLAQLHQLRGRIGRGKEPSVCFLIPESEDAFNNARLQALQKTNDGFLLADIDLKQRGPGDFLGYRQSGFKESTLQNIMNVELIEKARNFSENIFKQDPDLLQPEHQEIKKKIKYYWNSSIGDLN